MEEVMGIELKECPVCTKVFEVLPQNCDNCSYDFSTNKEETEKLRAEYMLMVSDLREAFRRLRTSGIIISVIGIISLVMAFLYYFEVNNLLFIFGTVTGIIFILCFFLVKTRPVIAVIVPLIFMIANNFLQIVFAFSQYSRATTINVVIIALLVYSLRSMIIVERTRKKYNKRVKKFTTKDKM
jgi:phosphotransferase system  glucose/maltose/N-acetylglucosamine-specific IIC component